MSFSRSPHLDPILLFYLTMYHRVQVDGKARGASAVLAVALVVLATAGCGPEQEGQSERIIVPLPQVNLLDTYAATVGDQVTFHGGGFLGQDDGWTELTFRGIYRYDDVEEPVNFTVKAVHSAHDMLQWRMGPYQVPFSRTGDRVGVFEGEVFATNYTHSGLERRQEAVPHRLAFEVKPSLIVRDVYAAGDDWQSDCLHLTTKLINYVPYRFIFQAIGFTPTKFGYTISEGLLNETGPIAETVYVEHEAVGAIDSLGELETIRFAEVPMAAPVYRVSISAVAFDEEGQSFPQFLMLTVHQPLQVRYRSGSEIAELMKPEVVKGCEYGHIQGRDVSYSETKVETKTISSTQSFQVGWTESYTESHTNTYGTALDEGYGFGFSSSDQSNWKWNVHADLAVEGGVDLGLVTKVTGTAGAGKDWGGAHTTTSNGQENYSKSLTWSEAQGVTQQMQESHGETLTEGWSVSSSQSETTNFRAFLLPLKWGVFYRQTVRLVDRADVVAMDLCGNETTVGEAFLSSFTWAADLAMGDECPPIPKSNLPDGVCLIPPCLESYESY